MPDISIIIPHKPGPSNDKALNLAVNSIHRFTNLSFELIIDATVPGDPYVIWNEIAQRARGTTLIFTNSDVVFAPGWDVLATHAEPNVIVTGYIIEPGNVGVAPVNIHRDYGKHPDNFDEGGFHSFVEKQKTPEVKEERGWYMPCAMNKLWFVDHTDWFPTEKAFPNPNDIIFWEYCKNDLGTKFIRVNSYSYHFQNQSARD
jgi:hypothetical protein